MTHPSFRRAIASILFAASLLPSGSVMAATTYLRGDASQVSNLNADAITSGSIAWPRIEDITCPPGQYPNKVVKGRWVCSAPTVSVLAGGTYTNAYTFNNRSNVFTGNGAALTNLNAANLTTGKLIWDRIADIACPTNGTVLTGFSGGKPVCATVGSGTVSTTGGVSGSGSANNIPLWTSAGALGGSILTQSGNTVTVNGSLTASTLSGSGANVTMLNAANITNGSMLWDRIADIACPTQGTVLTGFSGGKPVCISLPSGTQTGGGNTTGGSVTSADQITTGMLADARLSTNVVLRNGTQTFTGVNTFSGTGNSFTGSGAGLTGLSASNISSGQLALARIANFSCGQGQYLSGISNGAPSCATLPAAGTGGTAGSGTASALAAGTYSNALTLNNTSNSFTGSGAGLTALNASNITGGTLSPARLPSPNCQTGYFVSGIGSNGAWTCSPPNGVMCPTGYYMSAFTGTQGTCLPLPATSASGASGNGTANYIARWTNGTTLGNGIIQDNGSGVGIGTAPASGQGLTSVGSSLGISGSGNGTGVSGSGGGVGVFGNGGAVGVSGQGPKGLQGTGTGSGAMGVYGSATNGTGLYGVGSNYGVWGQGAYGVGGSGSTYGVYGTATTANGYGVYGENMSGGYSGYFAGGKGVAIVGAASNYGIGLKVDGRISTGDSNGVGGVWVDTAQQKFVGANGTNIGFYNNGAWGLLVDNSAVAHASMPAAPASQTMCWIHDATYNSTGLAAIGYCSSSIKVKKDVKALTLGMDALRKLEPKVFNWKSDGSHDLGFIAEDVEKVDPILVEHDTDGSPMGVKYGQISAVIVNAMKEQDARINTLETENKALKTRLEKIEAALKLKK